ncbi:hypothetical protein ACFLQL_00200 [Verrucomicrobiota bacterium]
MTYILPQVQVFQDFREVPTGSQLRNAFTFGPHYKVFRDTELGEYINDADTAYDYPSQPSGSIVDIPFFELYMTDVLAQYIDIAASVSNPLVAVSNVARNKLRAAPRINDAETIDSDSVVVELGGFYTGGVDLPEKYYFYPTGGWTGSAWESSGYISDIDASEDAKLAYITTEDITGTMDILASEDPLTAGVTLQGPTGIVFNFSPGTRTTLRAPRTFRVSDALGTSYFDISPLSTKIKDIIDAMIDASAVYTFEATINGVGPLAVTFDTGTLALDITVDNLSDTLTAVRAAVVAAVGVTDYFTVGAIEGTAAELVTQVLDEADVAIADATPIAIITDAYRSLIQPNEYIFSTGNGVDNSSHFKTRGVQVNDRVYYEVTVGATTYTGMTKVTGFEADYTLEIVNIPTYGTVNAVTDAGIDLSSGVAMLEAGTDNQRDFDGAETKLYSLSSAVDYYPGEYSMGVLAENMIVTVTTGGAAGTALVSITSENGTYSRDNVPTLEGADATEIKFYIGRNMYMILDQGAGDLDAELQVGDTYGFSTDAVTPFTAISASVLTSGGTYIGPQDTTYVVEVVRGGVFDRVVTAIDGLAVPTGVTATLMPAVEWTELGDVDDEYILRCTNTGTITVAEFAIESQRGDNQTGIKFAGLAIGNVIDVGSQGLSIYFTSAGAPTFTEGDYWVIRVDGARPQVKVTDSAGIDQSSFVTVEDDVALALGLYGATLTFAANTNTAGGFATNGGLVKGDVFYVAAEASAASDLKTLVLSDDLPAEAITGITYDSEGDAIMNITPSRFGVTLYLPQSETAIASKKVQAPPDYNWLAATDDFTVYQDIAVQDTSWVNPGGDMPYLPVHSGTIYIKYRALLQDYTDTLYTLSDVNDVVTELGEISADNPLALGVYNALLNSGAREVYFMAVATDDLAGFSTVLERAELNDIVYSFNPLTRDLTILDAVKAHMDAMSQAETKRWRIAFVGTELPTVEAKYTLSTSPISANYLGTVTDDPGTTGDQYTILTVTNGSPTMIDDIKANDQVYINFATDAWGDATYDIYEVDAVLSNSTLRLKSGPVLPITIPIKVEIWHPYSVAEMATAMAARSTHFSSSRVYHVAPSDAYNGTMLITSEFSAACVAGLCSSVPPQQGLTNIEITGLTDIPMAYRTFTRAQLNEMAGAGTLLLMQDIPGSRIYIRHQVSTAAGLGNLNTTELSMVKNLDSISYYFSGTLTPYIGRYNVTPDFLDLLNATIQGALNYLASQTAVGILGPQLIAIGSEIKTLEQHPVLKDHVLCTVLVNLPAPFNVIELHLVV